jgi:hypothetical protein
MELEKSWRKVALSSEDLKRITTKVVKEKDRKAPKGYREVHVYCVDNVRIKGGIKQAANILKQKIWEAKRRHIAKLNMRKGLFK